jgi:hypothetical protein
MIGGIGNGGSGSMRRSMVNGKNGQGGNVNSKTTGNNNNHKRSLDSQNIYGGHPTRNAQNRHSTNGNFYSNYHQPQKQHPNLNPNIKSGK